LRISTGIFTKRPAIIASVRALPLCAWMIWTPCLRRMPVSAFAERRSISDDIGSA
jgi:hypothetical protein